MVASITNISLVPMEMISTGLPLIEFEDGSYSHFFDSSTAILTDYSHKTLSKKILDLINKPEELGKMNHRARTAIERFTWSNTCEEFENIINKL